MSSPKTRADIPPDSSVSKTRKDVVEFTHLWTIENFSFFLDSDSVSSPFFSSGTNDGIQWCVFLYPNGWNEDGKDFISVFLSLRTCGKGEVLANFRITLLPAEKEPMEELLIFKPLKFTLGTGWGRRKLIRRDVLFKNQRNLLPGNKLTLFCEIAYSTGGVSYSLERTSIQSKLHERAMSGVLNEVFETRRFPDVILAAGGKEFRAHKAILAARSPILGSIFERNFDEGRSLRVEVSDIDGDTLADLLRFIYTGEAEAPEQMATLLGKLDERTVRIATRVRTTSGETINQLHEVTQPLGNIQIEGAVEMMNRGTNTSTDQALEDADKVQHPTDDEGDCLIEPPRESTDDRRFPRGTQDTEMNRNLPLDESPDNSHPSPGCSSSSEQDGKTNVVGNDSSCTPCATCNRNHSDSAQADCPATFDESSDICSVSSGSSFIVLSI